MTRRTASWITPWIVGAALVLAGPTVGFAHDRLKSSSPAADAKMTVVPRELRLNFSEVPDLTLSWIRLVDATGHPVAVSAISYAADSKRSVITAVQAPLDAGQYTIQWQVVGDDGHPTRDSLHFVIVAGAAGIGVAPAAPTPGAASQPTGVLTGAGDAMSGGTNGFTVESPVYIAVRWLTFITLLLAIGAVVFRQIVLRSINHTHGPDPVFDEAARRAARIGYQASLGFLVTLVARLLAQSLAMNDRPTALDLPLLAAILRHTTWGIGWHLQLVGVLIAGVGFGSASRGPPGAPSAHRGWLAGAVGVAILAFSSGLAGHAAAAPRLGTLTFIADGFHILGGGGWLGTLAVLLMAGIPAAVAAPADQRDALIARLVNAFSPTALVFAGLVAATGVFSAWIHLGSISALWQTPYGSMLFRKLVVLSVAVGAGGYNWLRIRPALNRGDAVVGSLRRSAAVEVMVGLGVLLLTAILVAMPTAMDMKM